MTGPYESPRMLNVLGRSIARLRGELEVYMLLALFSAVISTAVTWFLMDDYVRLQQMGQQGEPAWAPVLGIVLKAFAIGVVSMVVYAGIYVVWIRSAMLGRDQALGTGFPRRVGFVLWRTISLAGYVFLVALGFVVINAVLTTVIGVTAGRESAAGEAAGLVLLLATMACMIPIALAYYVAVVGSALDERLPIIQALKEMRGLWRPVIGAFLVGLAVYIAVALTSSAMTMTSEAEPAAPALAVLVLSNLLGALVNLYIFSVAMTALEEIRRKRDPAA